MPSHRLSMVLEWSHVDIGLITDAYRCEYTWRQKRQMFSIWPCTLQLFVYCSFWARSWLILGSFWSFGSILDALCSIWPYKSALEHSTLPFGLFVFFHHSEPASPLVVVQVVSHWCQSNKKLKITILERLPAVFTSPTVGSPFFTHSCCWRFWLISKWRVNAVDCVLSRCRESQLVFTMSTTAWNNTFSMTTWLVTSRDLICFSTTTHFCTSLSYHSPTNVTGTHTASLSIMWFLDSQHSVGGF